MTTPAGIWNGPEQTLATMLSVCTPFQTFCGVASAAAALARIHFEGLPDPADTEKGEYTAAELAAYRPCAVISAPAEDAWRASRVAEQTYRTRGRLLLFFLRSVSGATHGLPSADDVTQYKNLIGPIIGKSDAAGPDGLLDLPWQSPYLATREIYLAEGPYRGDPEAVQDEGVWLESMWVVEW